MKVYKYRGIYDEDDEIFERDLASIQKNYFWGANFDTLNDPCETIITTDSLISQSKIILPLLGKSSKANFQPVLDAVDNLLSQTKKIGIYSLSKTYIDELLWAHYANSHKGFCIEYDLDILLKTYGSDKIYSFPIKYKKRPPSFDFKDIINTKNPAEIIQKMAGHKPLRWKHEEEIRIIIEKFGEYSYDYDAVKAIYFGLRMEDKHKDKIMKSLQGRGINYYQIELIPKTYKFKELAVIDKYYTEPNYLTRIEISDGESEPCKFRILEKKSWKRMHTGEIRIELERRITKTELKWLAEKIKEEIFKRAEKIHMFYYLKDDDVRGIAWATSHFMENKIELVLNDF